MKYLETYEIAQELKTNWKKFSSFNWHEEDNLVDPEEWGIYYCQSNASTLLEESNSEVIAKLLSPYLDLEDGDLVYQYHSHWLVGWLEGYSVRVFRKKKDGSPSLFYTPAFKCLSNIIQRLSTTKILDKKAYKAKQLQACLNNIRQSEFLLKKDCNNPDWVSLVYKYLKKHFPNEIANDLDDLGAYPSEESVAVSLHNFNLLEPKYNYLKHRANKSE